MTHNIFYINIDMVFLTSLTCQHNHDNCMLTTALNALIPAEGRVNLNSSIKIPVCLFVFLCRAVELSI